MGEDVERFVSELKHHWTERPFVWGEDSALAKPVAPPQEGLVLALAPHPDDPESAAIACDLLRSTGCTIAYSIVSLSPEGVEDRYVETHRGDDLRSVKAAIRRGEQERAAQAFGLDPARLAFLGLDDRTELEAPTAEAALRAHLDEVAPDVVILPVGRDANETHRWVASVFRRWAVEGAEERRSSIVALYIEDPKTKAIRDDLFVVFDEERARGKRSMLRCHDTQQQRNLLTRSIGFDERILGVNRSGYERLPKGLQPTEGLSRYAEVFELEIFGAHRLTGRESHEPQG